MSPAQTSLTLRDYQTDAIAAVFDAWKDGMQRPAVVLPTGAGKTVVMSHLVQRFADKQTGPLDNLKVHPDLGARAVILVHRDELADQTLDKLRQIAPELRAGKVKAGSNDIDADVMVCSVQTLAREARFNRLADAQEQYGRIGLVIVDECFPAGTPVGGFPIESLKPGDVVPTWNEETGREEGRPVLRAMSKRPSAMVRVTLADGTSFACTPNHPILTAQGWCPAGMLWEDARVASFSSAPGNNLHGVRDASDVDGQSAQGLFPAERPGVLLGRMPGHLGTPGSVRAHGADEPRVRLGAHDAEQPDAQAGDAGQGVGDSAAYRAQAEAAGRERYGSDGTAASVCGVPGLGDRDGHNAHGRRDALALPRGHRAPDDEGRGGGGRGIALLAGPPSLRPEEGREAVFTRVVGVQVLEPGRDGTYGGVCPDGLVYNIEVDTTHTYLIGNGVVVHNCHHAAAVSYRNILAGLGCFAGIGEGAVALGVTATLARGDGQGLGGVWEDAVFTRSPLWMMARGHLVDVKSKLVSVDTLHLSAVKKSRGDYQAKDLGDAMMEAGGPQIIRKVLAEHAADRRSPIVFTPTVEVARATAEALGDAAYVHGGTPREERLDIYRKYRTGEVRTLVNCMVLTEGADFPFADCAVIARPTQSQPLFIQMVGRVLRPSPATGKTDALALILAGEGGSLCTLVDLEPGFEGAVKDDESLADAYEREEETKEKKVPAGSLRFELKHRDIDLFQASAAYSWLRTAAGVQFIPLGGAGEVLLWPSKAEPEKWDVAYAPPRGTWERLHTALDLGLAQAWAESEATDRSSLNMTKSASWRRKPANEKQIRMAVYLGMQVRDGATAGEVSQLIDLAMASRKLDKFVR